MLKEIKQKNHGNKKGNETLHNVSKEWMGHEFKLFITILCL